MLSIYSNFRDETRCSAAVAAIMLSRHALTLFSTQSFCFLSYRPTFRSTTSFTALYGWLPHISMLLCSCR